MNQIKDEVIDLLNRLPDDTSLEDIQYHLYVIETVRNGLDSIEKEGGLTQQEVEEKLSKWLTP